MLAKKQVLLKIKVIFWTRLMLELPNLQISLKEHDIFHRTHHRILRH